MNFTTAFTFRDTSYQAEVFLDFSEYPYYVFVILQDHLLLQEFGSEVSIKNDSNTILPMKEEPTTLQELRQAIFYAVKTTSTFTACKAVVKAA
ncbi:MAG TPA: hypothetical protein VD794_01875 [Flavisolibacter sp.]|nr:hypothetical protein [Flavisolibacter sp.]